MMMMHGGWMFFCSLLFTFVLLGFAYLVWVNACDEDDATKYTGQTIALIIAILAIVGFLYSGIYGRTMSKDKMMMEQNMHKMMMRK